MMLCCWLCNSKCFEGSQRHFSWTACLWRWSRHDLSKCLELQAQWHKSHYRRYLFCNTAMRTSNLKGITELSDAGYQPICCTSCWKLCWFRQTDDVQWWSTVKWWTESETPCTGPHSRIAECLFTACLHSEGRRCPSGILCSACK